MASTNYGPSTGWLEMSSIDRPVRRAIYLAVLSATEPSPLLPETGDEPPKPPTPPEGATPAAPPPQPAAPRAVNVRIDFDGISQRILAVNIPAGDYGNLTAGAAGSFYYTEPTAPGAAVTALAALPTQRARRCAVPRGHSFILAFGRQEEASLPGAPAPNRWGIVPTDRPAR